MKEKRICCKPEFIIVSMVIGLLLFNLVPTLTVQAETIMEGNCGESVTYILDSEGTLTISGEGAMYGVPTLNWDFLPTEVEKVVIDDDVTDIGKHAFYGFSELTRVEIANSVTSIGDQAFAGCTSLESINLPNSITKMGSYVFSQCSKLKSVIFPSSMNIINSGTFSDCSSLKKIEIPKGVLGIDFVAFSGCTSLEEIVFPDGMLMIGSSAFEECSGLKRITIPDSVYLLEDGAFEKCSGLESIEIPASITEIEADTFAYCTRLKNVTLPNTLKKIGKSAFANCSGLTSIKIPDSVTSLGVGVFENCSSLTNVELSNGLTEIPGDTFKRCTGLKSFIVPNGVTWIASTAFWECSGLTSITIPTSVKTITGRFYGVGNGFKILCYTNSYAETYAKDNNFAYELLDKPVNPDDSQTTQQSGDSGEESKLPAVGTQTTISSGTYKITASSSASKTVTFVKTKNSKKASVTIPDTIKIDGQTYKVTEVAAKAFKNNKILKSVTIGKNVKKIGKEAFSGCKKLNKITIKSTTLKSVGKNAIKGINAKATIKCPKKQLSAYKKLFKSKTGYKKTMKVKK